MTPLFLSPYPELPELISVLDDFPVFDELPAMSLKRSDCDCHVDWLFTHPQRPEPFSAYTTLYVSDAFLWGLFEWVLDLVYAPQVSGITEFPDDENGFYWGIEDRGEEGLICRLCTTFDPHAFSGSASPIEVVDAIAFRCTRQELVTALSRELHRYFSQDFDSDCYRNVDDPHAQSLIALAPEWPWNLLADLFPWQAGVGGDPPLPRWGFELLLFEALHRSARKSSRIYLRAPLRQRMLISLWWALLLYTLAESTVLICPEADRAGFSIRVEGFAAYRLEAELALDTLSVFLHGLDRFDTDYEEATARKYIATSWWWVAHVRESLRQAIPGIDWQDGFQYFRDVHPALYKAFRLLWGENAVYLACFGPDSTASTVSDS